MSEFSGPVEERMGQLNRVMVSIRAGRAPPEHEIDGLLESGFGELIALEAKLQRTRGASVGSLSDIAVAGHRESNAIETLRLIEALREALSQLQAASGDARRNESAAVSSYRVSGIALVRRVPRRVRRT